MNFTQPLKKKRNDDYIIRIYDGAKKGSSFTSPIGSGNYNRKIKKYNCQDITEIWLKEVKKGKYKELKI